MSSSFTRARPTAPMARRGACPSLRDGDAARRGAGGKSGMQEGGGRRPERARGTGGRARRLPRDERRERPRSVCRAAAGGPGAGVTAIGAMRNTDSGAVRKPLRAGRYGGIGQAGSRRRRRASVSNSHVISPTDHAVRAAQEGQSSCAVRSIIIWFLISFTTPGQEKVSWAGRRRTPMP